MNDIIDKFVNGSIDDVQTKSVVKGKNQFY